MNHTTESNNEAWWPNAIFFLPPYVTFSKLEDCQDSTNHLSKSIVQIKFPNLVFKNEYKCKFSVLIDPKNEYSSIVNKLGLSPPKKVHIPYTTSSNKHQR